MESMGSKIKQLRLENKLTQKELADKLSVGLTTISNYETGYSTPDINMLIKLSKVLNTSIDYLAGKTNISANNEFIDVDEFPEGVDVLRRGTRELSPKAREVMIKHMNQFIDDLAEMEKNNKDEG